MEASLKIIKQQLQSILKRLDWKAENMATSQGQVSNMRLSGLASIRNVINDIKTLNLFDGVVDSLSNSAIFTTANDQMIIQILEGREIVSNLTLLKTLSTNFLNVLLTTVPEEDINSINIKLPPVNDFDELSKVSRDIHIGLSQVIFNDEINGQTKIVSVENGSIWLNVFVGASAVTVIASLVWASAVIYKKIHEGKLLAEQVRGLKVKNDSLEDILKAQKAETDLMIQAEAEHISSEHFKENIPENIERIKNSIKTFAELIGKGAEIHPALVAPENVSNLFPDPTKLIVVGSKIKKLANPIDN
ncbi:hypothetical protein [Solitalea lacus]|uniref:hypothetical protein n=1 Tax=Solitalea lacus TaxID=2911172 RepID=UPI001ED9F744|nr:hypothetical protein [Solitalea lacus]UKJ06200.1 hypothetical protein L2B55_11695 [Solitalea lacus]